MEWHPQGHPDPSPTVVPGHYPDAGHHPDAGHFFPNLQQTPEMIREIPLPEAPKKNGGEPRKRNGKQMISMKEPKKRSGKQLFPTKEPKKIVKEDLRLCNLERFMSIILCKNCHNKSNYDGKKLTISLCAQCARRANKK
ncbi:unnamed protein product [Caenorhabditis nigoni]